MRRFRFRHLSTPLALLGVVSALPLHAAISIYVPPEALAANAPVVVEGTVERIASGFDPVHRAVATYVTIQVARMHRGPAQLGRIVLREPGGEYGGLVHEVDAVPVFHAGERVLVFAEPAADGSLRTLGMFFGKYTLVDSGGRGRRAMREMSGRGLILRAPPEVMEELPLADLVALVTTTPLLGAPVAVTPRAAPPEFERVLWDAASTREAPAAFAERPGAAPGPNPDFVSASVTYPARWEESDAGIAIAVDVERARNPLGDGRAALAEIARAMGAWTAVAESRAALRIGNGDAGFTPTSARSPAVAYPSANIILFGDPYDDLSDPLACAGTIAFGGYWRTSTPGRTVNGVAYFPIKRLYVVFNRGFECFLGEPRNLAEIATHELGHGLGLGHSSVPDSIMRTWAYGDRGAVLGADDRDAAHCIYPHAFTVLSPNGGESWTAGTVRTITWTGSIDPGGDRGTVVVEWSVDGGLTWRSIAAGLSNGGSLAWRVPDLPGIRNRVRVSRGCSGDASNAGFTIRRVVPLPPRPGR